MTAYPYTGSGYGGAGIPYANDEHGQSFKVTTTEDIVQTAASVPIFKTFVSLLKDSGLDYELAKAGPFTVFAPTDSAFMSLMGPHGFVQLAPLLRPENRSRLVELLSYHVVSGDISSGAIKSAGSTIIDSLQGSPLSLVGYNKNISAGNARVIKTDLPCSNGVIHVIGSVLVPPGFNAGPVGPVKLEYPDSVVLDVYGKLVSPRQALGIDPLPAGYKSGVVPYRLD